MEDFVKGDVVVLPFPFSDLSGAKRRPALVLATLQGSDILLCQITSQYSEKRQAIELAANDFASGSLPVASYIRPTRIFAADSEIIIRKAGHVSQAVMEKVIDSIIVVLKQ